MAKKTTTTSKPPARRPRVLFKIEGTQSDNGEMVLKVTVDVPRVAKHTREITLPAGVEELDLCKMLPVISEKTLTAATVKAEESHATEREAVRTAVLSQIDQAGQDTLRLDLPTDDAPGDPTTVPNADRETKPEPLVAEPKATPPPPETAKEYADRQAEKPESEATPATPAEELPEEPIKEESEDDWPG